MEWVGIDFKLLKQKRLLNLYGVLGTPLELKSPLPARAGMLYGYKRLIMRQYIPKPYPWDHVLPHKVTR